MMAASAASIIEAYPGQEQPILAMAAVSNLITTILGVYVGIYVSLPLAERFYRLLTRRQAVPDMHLVSTSVGAGSGTGSAAGEADEALEKNREFRRRMHEAGAAVQLPLAAAMAILAIVGVGAATVAAKGFSVEILMNYAVMVTLVLVSMFLAKVTRKVSPVIWVTTIGAYVSSPWFFAGE
jgi:hypothetical protein